MRFAAGKKKCKLESPFEILHKPAVLAVMHLPVFRLPLSTDAYFTTTKNAGSSVADIRMRIYRLASCGASLQHSGSTEWTL